MGRTEQVETALCWVYTQDIPVKSTYSTRRFLSLPSRVVPFSWLAGLSCTRYDQMAARTPKAVGDVKATQPIVDFATIEDEEDKKGCGGDKTDKNAKGGEEQPDGREDKDFEGDAWEEGEVERGMLHALVELGNLEMLLHQVSGCCFRRGFFSSSFFRSDRCTAAASPPPLLQHT